MELTGLGGGVMLAIAAVLWLVYLLPNWFRRREYLATERNAVRLQQTIRILAETAEVPREVRAEQLARIAARQPVAVGRAATIPTVRADVAARAAHRRRRTRVLATLVLAFAIGVAAVQVGIMLTAGVVGGAWIVLGASALVAFGSFMTLSRLAERARQQAPVAAAPRRTAQPFVDHRVQPQAATPRQPWTPVPVPQPLYLSRTSVMEAAASVDPKRELELAAASAERALRSMDLPPAVVPAVASAAPSSRFASMGIVDDASTSTPDLDAVLARRRAAG